jgi:hypothetical protein
MYINYNPRLFSQYVWTLRTEPDKITYDSSRNMTSVSKEDLNAVEISSEIDTLLVVPLSRDHENFQILRLPADVTLKILVNTLHEFYHKTLTDKDVQQVKAFRDNMFKYKSNLIHDFENGEKVSWVNLRGDAVHFEGVRKIQGNLYCLVLGS